MTVMIDRFFGLHQHFVRSGLCRRLRAGEIRLYIGLMHESERRCTRKLNLTDTQIRELVGVASRTLCNARKRLQEFGLLQYHKTTGNMYVYTICQPEKGEPYPGGPKQRIPYEKKPPRTPVSWASKPSREPEHQTDLTSKPVSAPSMPTPNQRPHNLPMSEHGLPNVFSERDK
ncbi:MAG TPA: hypothetical protein VNW97_20965 [Candidatus Saccharimonadales bacterium]|jgi:hypothetical protein|nr:hypothetical protein [Candidatus Saccharimonadales bacterium]